MFFRSRRQFVTHNKSILRPVRFGVLFFALFMANQLLYPRITFAADALRVGKSVPQAFSFVPLDVGMKSGIFKKNGLDIDASAFAGDAKMQQAMAAESIDIGIGSGPAMAFIAKGAPIKAVAAMAGRPLLLTLAVRADGSIKTVTDLKGKKVGVSTVGSLTYWVADELSRQRGWGVGGIEIVPVGAFKSMLAALKTKQIDGMVTDVATAYEMEKSGEGKILYRFGDLVKDFHIHVIFATNKIIANRPDAIRAFLKGWFETIAFMRKNKATSVNIAKDIMETDTTIAGRVYDELMPMFSDDGKFDPKALAVLSRSYVELQVLDNEPDMTKLFTEAFLPRK
jgi:ABC-type nitrate/sulfonate/bicarbonate transport system substrate-binding protein